MGHTYVGHDYIGHNYMGHNYIGLTTIDAFPDPIFLPACLSEHITVWAMSAGPMPIQARIAWATTTWAITFRPWLCRP